MRIYRVWVSVVVLTCTSFLYMYRNFLFLHSFDRRVVQNAANSNRSPSSSCVKLPRYCLKKSFGWPTCNVTGEKLPFGQTNCLCVQTENFENKIPYRNYVGNILNNGKFFPTAKSNIPVFFINLDQSVDREFTFRKALQPVFSTILRVSAVTPASPMLQDLEKNFSAKDENIMAVLLSHRKALETALKYCKQYNRDYALIMEDDVSLDFSIYWRYKFDQIVARAPKDWLSIQLGYTRLKMNAHEPYYYTVGADERGNVRTKEHFISGFWRKSEWGAFAYLMKVEGMKKILARTFPDMKRQCNTLTADDCLLGFSPDKFAEMSPLYEQNYLLVPPYFGINIDVDVTHRKSRDRVMHLQSAVAGQCMSLFENIWAFNYPHFRGSPTGNNAV